jgi:isopentenyl-diphosphate Delta-isomerase
MSETLHRKEEHLRLCLEDDVSSGEASWWDEVKLPHCALPDVDESKIDFQSEFLGETFSAPFLISSMSGGTEKSEMLNDRLAVFAQEVGIPMGVGSQRILLEGAGNSIFRLKKTAPRLRVYANIGAVQLNYGITPSDIQRLVDHIEARGVFLHLNPLQEAIQPEGNRNFSGLWPKIEKLRKQIQVPLILKETGCGLDVATGRRAVEAGIDALDVAGKGGTHWGYVEGLRNASRLPLGQLFRNWGLPTPQALQDRLPKPFKTYAERWAPNFPSSLVAAFVADWTPDVPSI